MCCLVNVMAGKCLLLRTWFSWHRISSRREISATYHSQPPADPRETNAHGQHLPWDKGCARSVLCAGWAGTLRASSGLGWNGEISWTGNTVGFECVHTWVPSPLLRNPCWHFQRLPEQCSQRRGCTALAHEIWDGFHVSLPKILAITFYYTREKSIPTCFSKGSHWCYSIWDVSIFLEKLFFERCTISPGSRDFFFFFLKTHLVKLPDRNSSCSILTGTSGLTSWK